MLPFELEREIAAFVHAEARFLDERAFGDWLALFADDGVYWVPGIPGQASPAAALSLFHESKALLGLRVERLAQSNLHAQAPLPRTHHQVAAIECSASDRAGVDYVVRSGLVFAEWRAGDARWYAGRVTHALRRADGALLIVEKKVELIDCDAPHRAITVPF